MMMSYILEGMMIFRRSILPEIVLFVLYELMFHIIKKKKIFDYKKEDIPQLLAKLLLAVYICTILEITGLIGRSYTWELSAFALKNLSILPFQGASMKMIILNSLLFIPYGFLAAIITKKSGASWWKLLLIGFSTSFVIELIQAFTGRLPEIDDLITNTVGFLVGLLIAYGFFELKDRASRKKGIYKIALTVVLFGIFLFIISFWAYGDQQQEQEDAYYESLGFNSEKMEQLSKIAIWKNGVSKEVESETSELYDWYSNIGIDISNLSGNYKVQEIATEVNSVIDKDKMYVEMEYMTPQSFQFYNNKSWEISDITCMLFCVDDGTVWYGTTQGKLEECAVFDDSDYEYSMDTQLMDELNTWMGEK